MVPYPLFALSGLMIWLFVHNSITMAINSFVSNANLVTKVYFPRLIVPIAATFAGLVDLLFSLALLVILMIYYGVNLTLANCACARFSFSGDFADCSLSARFFRRSMCVFAT